MSGFASVCVNLCQCVSVCVEFRKKWAFKRQVGSLPYLGGPWAHFTIFQILNFSKKINFLILCLIDPWGPWGLMLRFRGPRGPRKTQSSQKNSCIIFLGMLAVAAVPVAALREKALEW